MAIAPSQTPAPTATAVVSTSRAPFGLTSAAFKDGGSIPSAATCDGAGASPELAWSGAPLGTRSLALIVTDPDAGDFVHWLAFDLTGAPDGRLAAGVSATTDAPRQGRNDFGRRGYGGPCPPSGVHHYRFDLFALDRPLGIGGTPGIADVRAAMQGHVLAQTRLTGTYRRR